MRPLLFNSLRYLTCLLALMPALALAQPEAPAAPCPLALAAAPNVTVAVAVPPVPPVPAMALSPQTSDLNRQQCNEEAEMGAYDVERRKTIDKTYKVNKSDMLRVENKFGNVHVNTWNRNEIQVKVEVISRAESEQAAHALLDQINISESRSGNTILVKTEMGSIRSVGKGSKGFEVNYTINMPDENQLAIKNSHGSVYLPALKGKVDVDVAYGSLKSDRLSNSSNSLKIAYGSGTCGYINGGNVDVAYSSLSLEGTSGLQGSSKFSNFKIGSVAETLDFEIKYGSLKVDHISKGIRRINLASGYSPISLKFEDNTAFDFDVNVQFGTFKVDKSLVNYTTLEKSHTSAAYKGKFGNASSKASVNIVSKYGDVQFTR